MIQPEQVSDEKITQLQIVLDNLKAEEQDFYLLKLCKTKEGYGSEISSMNEF